MSEKSIKYDEAIRADDEIMDAMMAALYVGAGSQGIPWRLLGLNYMPSQDAITRAAAAMVKE